VKLGYELMVNELSVYWIVWVMTNKAEKSIDIDTEIVIDLFLHMDGTSTYGVKLLEEQPLTI